MTAFVETSSPQDQPMNNGDPHQHHPMFGEPGFGLGVLRPAKGRSRVTNQSLIFDPSLVDGRTRPRSRTKGQRLSAEAHAALLRGQSPRPPLPLGVRLSPDVFPYCTPHFLARISLNLQEVTRTPIKVSV